MAGAARIGALHVMLGLDSAQFSAGLAKASTGLDRFARGAKVGLGIVATAAAAAGAALAVAVKGAIDTADEMSKTAQKVGVTTEALSRLNWAAKLSDVGLEQLATGLQRLSRNMLDVSNGAKGPAKTAFDALGISVTDANGKLRASDEVFADIADRFSRMPDGAEKTALAMQLLGKSGAEMIPLLNAGRDGLAEMADESDRLGNTISTSTGKAAEAFNDSITRLQAGLQGMVNKIAQAALPTLNNLIETLTSPDFMAAMQDFAIAAVATADAIAQVFIGAHKAFKDFLTFIGAASPGGEPTATRQGSLESIFPSEYGAAEADIKRQMEWSWNKGTPMGGGADPYAGFGMNSDGTIKIQETKTAAQQLAEVFETLGGGGHSAAAGAKALKDAMAEGKAVFEATRTPAEAYGLEVERLNALLQKGAIDQETYNRAVSQAQDAFQQAEQSGNQLASTLASGLANVFSSVVDGSKSAVEAVGDLLKSLGQMLINQGFQALIGGIFGGGAGGGLGSIISSIFGGGGGGLTLGFNGIPGYADGTNYAQGGMALVGERGPELVNLPRGSQVIPNDELGMGGPTISINITGSRQDAAEIAREIRKVLPDAIQSYNRNPLRRSS